MSAEKIMYIASHKRPRGRKPVKTPRSDAWAEKTQLARQNGFVPAQLLAGGILHVPDTTTIPAMSTLDNTILQVFDEDNWNPIHQDIHEFLQPALRLASLFLTQRTGYFQNLLFSKRNHFAYTKPSVAEAKSKDQDYQWIHHPTGWSASRHERVKGVLQQIAEFVTFNFVEEPGEKKKGQGSEQDAKQDDGKDDGKDGGEEQKNEGDPMRAMIGHTRCNKDENGTPLIDIDLHHDLYLGAKELLESPTPNQDMILRYHFNVAVILTHEMAHALNAYKHQKPKTDKNKTCEAFYGGYPRPEAGYAWELDVLGAVPTCICDGTDISLGLYADPCEGEDEGDSDATCYAMRMAYIYDIQQKEHWAASARKKDFGKIPRDGLSAQALT